MNSVLRTKAVLALGPLLAVSLSGSPLSAAAMLAPNQLTAAEKKEGWVLLFDGVGAAQWRGYQKADMTGLRWKVEDDCLALPPSDGSDTKGSRDIVSKKLYGNFEFAWEWRVAPGGNSGVKYLVTEDRESAIGHEYQIIDDDRHADAGKRDSRRTGSFYDVLPAPSARPHPAGRFNQSRVLVQGNRVEHWLNGEKILAYELSSDALRKAIADSKFKGMEGFEAAKRGHLLLQDHGDAVCYRTLKIRELP
jgi:hypothetical protein